MEPAPCGIACKELLDPSIKEVVNSWNEKQEQKEGTWTQAVAYVTLAVDYFIRQIEGLIPSGQDKKATVLAAISDVYDMIVPGLLPIWLRPFNSRIKAFVIDVVISIAIDFIVSKYRKGSWNEVPEEVVEEEIVTEEVVDEANTDSTADES